MSGAAVVIIIGGGTQQNRLVEDDSGDVVKIRVTLQEGESMVDAIRRAAYVLEGAS